MPEMTRRTIGLLTAGAILIGCTRVPDYVIPPDDMSRIMADMHTAETMVENNYVEYRTDSAKMLVKQSVVGRYGYTLDQLDTSFMWYGANLTVYNDVYDKTVSILEDRLAAEGATRLQDLLENEGDSVNLWAYPSFMMIRPSSPSMRLPFAFKADEGWDRGDIFTLRAKFSNVGGSPRWSLTADYDDGSFEVLSTGFSGDGWHEVSFYTDSVKTAADIYGTLDFDLKGGVMIVDSISFIRKPLNPQKYSQRYRQRAYDFSDKRKLSAPTDTTLAEP